MNDEMIEVWNNTIHQKELNNFNKAVAERNIMEGPVLTEFEKCVKDLLKVDFVIGTSSGSAALTLALMGIGIMPGDEVIVPDLTFVATANAACILGADVVVAPVKENYTLLDEDAVDDFITEKTKAIITVDLNGRISNSARLREKFAEKGIYIIDDACQSFMSCSADQKMAGTDADISCYSFGISKTVTTVMGGLIATNKKELYEKMKIMKTQGMTSIFEGDEYKYPGFNFKLPDVLAAIGMGQLERLDKKMHHMCKINQMYRQELAGAEGIDFLPRKWGEHPWMTDILCEDKDKVRKILTENGISCRPLGAPLHTAYYLKSKGEYVTSDRMRESILYLPSGPDQSVENVEKVIKVLKCNDLVK